LVFDDFTDLQCKVPTKRRFKMVLIFRMALMRGVSTKGVKKCILTRKRYRLIRITHRPVSRVLASPKEQLYTDLSHVWKKSKGAERVFLAP
jgi:hypothetical protein